MRCPTRLLLVPAALVLLSACGGDPPAPDDAGTPPPDGVGPTMLAAVPQPGSTDVRIDTSVIIEFSEPVAPSSLIVSASPQVSFAAPKFEYGDTVVTLEPLTPLAGDTHFVVQGAVADLEGNRGEFGFEFTTAIPDTTAPSLVSTTPATGATDVSIDQALSLTFSERMSPASLSLTVEPNNELEPAEWSEDGTQVTVKPGAAWKVNTTYKLSIAASDAAGNALPTPTEVTFVTLKPTDAKPPIVLNAAPPANATNVPANANIAISFSEAMSTTATQAAFSATPAIDCVFLWDESKSLLTCDPQSNLTPGTQYSVALSTSTLDAQGNALAAPYTFSFTATAASDTTRPTVVNSSPADGVAGVARNGSITVQFSESMDRLSTQAAFAITEPASANDGTFFWDALSTTLTFSPSTPFAYGTDVKWTVGAAAKDFGGNAIEAFSGRGFKVIQNATVDLAPAFDGHARNDLTVCTSCTSISVGDDATKRSYRGYFSFSLAGLPANTTKITSATLYVYQSACDGSPFTSMGALRAESVNIGPTLDATDYASATLGGHIFTVSTVCGTARTLSSNVLNAVNDDWAARAMRGSRSQFRLRFATATDSDATTDRVLLNGVKAANEKPYLRVTYEYP